MFLTTDKSTIKRTTWTTPEKHAVREGLSFVLKKNIVPTLDACQELIKTNSLLSRRTAVQIKAWAYNLIKKVKSSTPKKRHNDGMLYDVT